MIIICDNCNNFGIYASVIHHINCKKSFGNNHMQMDLEDRLVSFDVVSLYTNIPINEAIDVINRITDPDTTHLVEICLTSTFFSFEGEFYEQTCGVAMGSPLSPIVANLFMEDFESKALSSALF